MKRFIVCGLIVLMIIGFYSSAYGDSKLERGSKNLALGWTEIPKSITETTKEKNAIIGITLGTLEGILNAFARTVSGAVDVSTLPITGQEKPAVKPAMIEGK
jgi:putative exosortase-associated protein (TIGR04073 family)